MDLRILLQELAQKFNFTAELEKDPQGFYRLEINEKTVLLLKENNFGLTCKSDITPIASDDNEDLLTLLMRANFTGQGTGGAILCLNPTGQKLLLQNHVFGDLNYKEFKEKIEEFVNYLNYWKTRVSDQTKK